MFSLFIFILSVTPCCADENECREECFASCSSNEHNSENQKEQKECSPFCACEMCGLHAFKPACSQVLKIPVNNPSLSARPGNFYSFQFISEFEVTIWQPPRLC